MRRPVLLFAALAPGLAAPLYAQDAPPASAAETPIISTSAAQAYPQVTCTTSNAAACAEVLQLAADTRDQLSSLLDLGTAWRFPVHIHVLTPDDPLTAKIDREASAVFAQGPTMKIEAVFPVSDPDWREFVQRQFLTAILWEKFFANTTSFDRNTKLDAMPLWLVEGLREWLNEDPNHDRESIVRRAVENQSASTLAEVTGWHELSTDRLLGLWQRAFCYYLVDSLTRGDARRADFQKWLAGFSEPDSSSAQLHFPTEADWQRELADATSRSRMLVYTWDETQAELTTDETITFADPKDAKDAQSAKVRTCLLDDAATLPRDPIVIEALQERIFVLTELELRAHPGWHSILELYRSALAALVTDHDTDRARALLQEAHRQQVAETANHQKLLDYINWFEVTKDYQDTSPFQSYFTTAKEMERIQADPAHPNPIRASLLQIESEL